MTEMKGKPEPDDTVAVNGTTKPKQWKIDQRKDGTEMRWKVSNDVSEFLKKDVALREGGSWVRQYAVLF